MPIRTQVKPNLLALALLGWFTVLPFAGAADAPGAGPLPVVPDALKAPAGEEILLVAKARGFQTYECRASKEDPTKYEWAFTGPEADLFDATGSKIGRHFAGPTWELSDGSQVVGSLQATVPAAQAGAVPWLLLAAKSHAGDGALTRVTHIQRLDTMGGKAPAGGASAAHAGEKVRIPYTAAYYFYGPQ